MCSWPVCSGEVVCRSVDGRLRGPPHCRQPSATPVRPARSNNHGPRPSLDTARGIRTRRAATRPATGAPLPSPAMSRGHASASGGCGSAGPPLSAPLPLPVRVPPQRQPGCSSRDPMLDTLTIAPRLTEAGREQRAVDALVLKPVAGVGARQRTQREQPRHEAQLGVGLARGDELRRNTDQPGRARPPPRPGGAAGRRHADHPEARRRLYQRQHPTGLPRRAGAPGRMAGDRPG